MRIIKNLQIALALVILSNFALQNASFAKESEKRFRASLLHVNLEEPYSIQELSIEIPGISVQNQQSIEIDSNTDTNGIRIDMRVHEAVNLYALAGNIRGSTNINLSSARISGLPIQAPNLNIDITGQAYGVGVDLQCCSAESPVYGSLSFSYSDTSLSGNFNSSIQSLTVQPRVGTYFSNRRGKIWIAGFAIDSSQEHTGELDFNNPLIPLIPISAKLETRSTLSYGIGASYDLADRFALTAEHHFSLEDRSYTLALLTYKF